jgi:hypothetical protein
MTANAFAADREACRKAGMNAFLPKPVEREDLVSVLTTLPAGKTPAARQPASSGASGDTIHGEPFNRRRIDALLRELGPDDTAFLLDSFATDAASLLADLSAALESGDAELAKRCLHTLKGAAANVGFDDLSHQAAALMAALPDSVVAGLKSEFGPTSQASPVPVTQ